MASELKSLLARAEQRPENRETFKALKNILQDVRSAKEPSLSMESFAESASREGIAMMLMQLTDVLSGPVAQLLEEISSDSRINDME